MQKKKKLRIISNSKKMDSHRELLKNNGNFTFLFSVYIFTFILCGEQQTFIYKELRCPKPWHYISSNFHLSITNLIKYQKEAHYERIKISIHLPTHIKCVSNEIQVFKWAWKRFLLSNSFYSTNEKFSYNKQYIFQMFCHN